MPNLNVGLGLAVFVATANAATYNCGYDCSQMSDSDYVYFENSNGESWNCGGYANWGDYVSHGETLEMAVSPAVYYCCDSGTSNDGYWIEFPVEGYITDAADSCDSYTTWVSLGSNKYCLATKTGTWDWCAGNAGYSGVIDYVDIGECVYSGTCSTFTHCGKGYYKNGSGCTACPNGGTTSGYTNTGISACYLPTGTSMSDTTGAYTCSSNAFYSN